MKIREIRLFTQLLAVVGILSLTACGGSDSDDDSGGNQPPTADAGEAQTVDAGNTVSLSGSGNDPDGNIEGFAWSQIDGPAVTLEGSDEATAAFDAPAVEEVTELAFELAVTDDDGESATDSVTVTVAPAVGVSGRVYDGPIAEAEVTVTVGERSYSTTADVDGYYSLNIGSLDPDAFVTFHAVGGAGEEHVELLGYAASFATLQSLAGADGVLERDEFSAVNITNLSTARAVLMAAENGGNDIASEDEARKAESHVDVDEMLRLATAIKLVVDGGFSLPAGVATTLDLVEDVAISEDFIETVNSLDLTAYDQAFESILSDSELLDNFDDAGLPATYNLLWVNSSSTGDPEYQRVGRGVGFEFNATGSGQVLGASDALTGNFDWQMANGEVAISFNPGLTDTGTCFVEGVGEIACTATTTDRDVQLLIDGLYMDHVRMTTSGTRSYPDNPEIDPVDYEYVDTWLAFDPSAEIPFTASEMPGTWGFQVAGEDQVDLGMDDLSAAMLVFNTDGTGSRPALDDLAAMDFNWSVATDGSLEVNFADGSSLVARRLRHEGIAQDTYIRFETASGDVFANAGLIVKVEAGAFTDLQPEDVKAFYTLYDVHPQFSITLQDGGVGTQRTYQETDYTDAPFSWSIQDDAVEIRYYQDMTSGEQVASCVGLSECYNHRHRKWIPLAFDDASGRLIVYELQENFWYDPAAVGNTGDRYFEQTGIRFWGRHDSPLDNDIVIVKPQGVEPDRRRMPWAKLPNVVPTVEQ